MTKEIYENIQTEIKAELLRTEIISGITVYILKRKDSQEEDRWCHRDFSKNWILTSA